MLWLDSVAVSMDWMVFEYHQFGILASNLGSGAPRHKAFAPLVTIRALSHQP